MAHLTTYEGFNVYTLPLWSDGTFEVSDGVYQAEIDGFTVEISGGFSGPEPDLRVSDISVRDGSGDPVYTMMDLDISLAALFQLRTVLEADRPYANNAETLDAYRKYINDLSVGGLTVDYFVGDGSDVMIGTRGTDDLSGGRGDDLIAGAGSDDNIFGNSGRDYLEGNGGNDTVRGNKGPDVIDGGHGDDSLNGGSGWDEIYGGKGDDTLRGGDGDDYISDQEGSDFLQGGAGDDRIEAYGSGLDTVEGGAGDDTISLNDQHEAHGGSGNDEFTVMGRGTVFGDGGDDFFEAYGRSTIEGGGGDDIFYVYNLQTVVMENEDEGTDKVWYYMSENDDTEFVLPDNVENARFETTYSIDESYEGSVEGNDLDNRIVLEASEYYRDVYAIFAMSGNGGNDMLRGGYLTDVISGGDGEDIIQGKSGSDTLSGGDGDDTFVYRSFRDSRDGRGVDVIEDFEDGDVIDLMLINAVRETGKDEAFTFIGDAAFSGTAGELRFEDGRLEADGTGDGEANFAVLLDGVESLSADDLIL